jgi:hypothetical protein
VHALIEENQLGRRNLSDDQKAMVAEGARERRADLLRREQLARARDVKAGRSVEANASPTEQKERTRTAVARENKIPERKLRAAAEVKHPSGRSSFAGALGHSDRGGNIFAGHTPGHGRRYAGDAAQDQRAGQRGDL